MKGFHSKIDIRVKQKFQFYRPAPIRWVDTKRKCGVDFVYLTEGSDKTQGKINEYPTLE